MPTTPFVKPGQQLNFTRELKERGMWPPRLHNKDDKHNNGQDRKPTATPFLFIPVVPTDTGTRPLPNSAILHSQGIWIETAGVPGLAVDFPAIGGNYIVKCRIVNIGAFASYGGLAEFYVSKPATLNAMAASHTAAAPALGRTGFSLLPGESTVVTCPNAWHPNTPEELQSGILVQAYDFIKDNVVLRYDAQGDRHVGRHDFTSDFYVRDWTDSSASHDRGQEPSSHANFFTTSDIWNRRSNAPGPFIDDRPQNQNPQAGTGAAGDNFMFARISRETADTKEKVFAHFMFAEFGTGSPYVNCSAASDPSVTFNPGDTSKILSLNWHLHPTSSPHLCIGVQIYSDADPYRQPGLLGNTPGWPVTDTMVLVDNNKAQKNMQPWNGVPDAPGFYYAILHNAALTKRDFILNVETSPLFFKSVKNAKVAVVGENNFMQLEQQKTLTLKNMLPGERRWMELSFDGFSAEVAEAQYVAFNEIRSISMGDGSSKTATVPVNGFAVAFQKQDVSVVLAEMLNEQAVLFNRLGNGFGIQSGMDGLKFTQELMARQQLRPEDYQKALPKMVSIFNKCIIEFSRSKNGINDNMRLQELIKNLSDQNSQQDVRRSISLHGQLLMKMDTFLTIVDKSAGDEASILFTMRLQQEVFRNNKKLSSSQHNFKNLLDSTNSFIQDYNAASNQNYPSLVRSYVEDFKFTAAFFRSNVLQENLNLLIKAFGSNSLAMVQGVHLKFLQAIINISSVTIPPIVFPPS
jgi:hypothetical protein